MSDVRIIKKYPNRRLYDTEISQYITLDEVKKLIIDRIKFKVIDVRTEEDMTNYVLLQIINEEESKHSPIFTAEILQNIIRFYGNPLQKNMSEFIEKSVIFFTEHQKEFQNYFQTFINHDNPINKFTELTKKNMEMWQSTIEQFYSHNPKKDKNSDDK